ncbi:Nicotianamine synthase [Byssothecium circinans]|uniref:Nicotianamine synthase n=1 Tax=Byssothecium circinans TaxID=147558 RepID=A0A6A5TSI7_9PLEO|nr:Nicotianamine synthase [Byssothecium circinans]
MVSITQLKTRTTGQKASQEAAKLSTHTPPATPTALSTAAYQLLNDLRGIYQELSYLDDLSPGEKVNGLLTRLVGLCIQPYGSEFEAQFLGIDGVSELCASLQPICAIAEGELERHWARRILDTPVSTNTSPRSLLRQFPYYTNYVDLSRLETSLLRAFLPQATTSTSPLHVAFIGSGPLPLTSFCLLDILPNVRIHNIDRDASALQASKELSEKLSIGKSMNFVHEDVSVEDDATDSDPAKGVQWEDMDVVFLAALVGMDTTAKLTILESLSRRVRPGTLILARSARGLRTVLYPVLELSEDLSRIGYDVLAELHPHTDVVNSVVVLRVRAL